MHINTTIATNKHFGQVSSITETLIGLHTKLFETYFFSRDIGNGWKQHLYEIV